MVTKSKRIVEFDMMKTMAMCFVVFHHCAASFFTQGEFPFFSNFCFLICNPIFLFISGFLTRKCSNARELLSNIFKNFISLFIPYFVLGTLLIIIGKQSFDIGTYFYISLFQPDILYFYLPTYFFISLILNLSVFVSNVFSKNKTKYKKLLEMLILFVFSGIGLGLFLIFYLKVGQGFLCAKYVIFFYCFVLGGYLVKSHKEKIVELLMKKKISVFLLIFSFFALSVGVAFSDTLVNNDNLVFGGIRIFVSACGILFFYLLFRFAKRIQWLVKISSLGKFSLGVYTVHVILLDLMLTNVEPSNFYELINVLRYFAFSMVVLVLTTFVVYGLSKNKIFNFLFFGVLPKKEKKICQLK